MFVKAFNPNKWKVVASFVATLISDCYIYLKLFKPFTCATVECIPLDKPCQEFPFSIGIIPHCCGCYTFTDFIGEILWLFIFPLFFFYIVFSIVSLPVELIRRLKQKTS